MVCGVAAEAVPAAPIAAPPASRTPAAESANRRLARGAFMEYLPSTHCSFSGNVTEGRGRSAITLNEASFPRTTQHLEPNEGPRARPGPRRGTSRACPAAVQPSGAPRVSY
nr:hypothetical protein StreXyl84_46240 [Streptomyces sp. Xyl84]